MKSILFVSLLGLFSFICSAQNLTSLTINSTGGSSINLDKSYEWSVGEMALVESMLTTKLSVTNGLLQPLPPLFILTPVLYVEASNVLSPNNDGSNDAWTVKDLNRYSENELTIVDRGGRIVYKVKNYQNDWVGDLDGLPLAEDTYFYFLILKKNGQTATQRGFISIIR